MDEKLYKNLIEEFSDNCPCRESYCSLRELMLHLAKDPRVIVQIKCVEKFKYERSKTLGRDIGWVGAFEEWVDKGFAEKFAEVYKEEKSIKQTYNECLGKVD